MQQAAATWMGKQLLYHPDQFKIKFLMYKITASYVKVKFDIRHFLMAKRRKFAAPAQNSDFSPRRNEFHGGLDEPKPH